MRYSETAGFLRSIKRLPAQRKESVKESISKLVNFFETKQMSQGLGLKQLRPGIWEIRAGLLDRIVFSRRKDIVEFIIAGTHNEIKNLLKNL